MTPGLIIAAKNAELGQRGVCQNSHQSSSAGWLLRKRCPATLGMVSMPARPLGKVTAEAVDAEEVPSELE